MGNADFWHEMAGEFERVDPTKRLHLVMSRGVTTKRIKLIVNSDFVTIFVRDKFHALAARAGAELDPASDSPVKTWLTEIRRTNQPDDIDPPMELMDPETGLREYHEIGQINDLGTVSAALCYRLETKARHGVGPQPIEQPEGKIDAHYDFKLQAEMNSQKRRRHDAEPARTPATHQVSVTERQRLIDDYKRECKESGVRVTDAMIAKAASSSWNDRTQVTWWKRSDPRSTAFADRAIRRILAQRPHLPKK